MDMTADKFINKAISFIGTSGGNTFIDIYNKQKKLPVGYKVKYTDQWCAIFVSAVGLMLGYDIILPECSCERMIYLYKAKGQWFEDESITPVKGDIIFYDWDDNGKGDNQGTSDHVGIVFKVSGNTIYVVEGNYNNAVKTREIKINGKYIRGFARPDYTKVVKAGDTISFTSYCMRPFDNYSLVDQFGAVTKNGIIDETGSGTIIDIESFCDFGSTHAYPIVVYTGSSVVFVRTIDII